ncbi:MULTISPECIES: hypothetical protein [Nostoc cyanobionts]|nr:MULTISPECIES: hypothetical protein [unclassified Nostoc]
MKVNRHGRTKILTQQEIQQIFAIGLTDRDRATQGQGQSYGQKLD